MSDTQKLIADYEIRSASILNPETIKNLPGKKPDWVIAGKNAISAGSPDHLAIYTEGYNYFW